MAKGECNCGSVKFEIKSKVSDVFICHCSICRKSTGSGGIAVVIVLNSDFSWVTGEELIQKWAKPGHDWETSFYKCCGSPLPGADSQSHMYVPAGLISADAEHLKVAHHLWVNSKAGWEVIGDSGQQHPEAFSSEA
ncbi:GFA family protein [Vibrio quintilis]|uniref:Glutathione-dependent formaldehyde-activating enzyme n=1 Tax=Vibrio quintilis TaxID=1117707 RepID=A0A1M7Z0Q6_9VIBR|nr:GFA family protein [Vibrio quintilis]SHO58423.1 Glutathione-dependent formaldehyde-activating enzyme [Vibrio quintilis]